MKKLLIIGSVFALVSTSALASKARLQALGEDKDGSYYISDFRNIYINPAHLNSLGNMVVMEWGAAGLALGGASLDKDDQTKAQGGVVYGLSNGLKIGAVLGDETDVAALTRMLSSNVYGTANLGAKLDIAANNFAGTPNPIFRLSGYHTNVSDTTPIFQIKSNWEYGQLNPTIFQAYSYNDNSGGFIIKGSGRVGLGDISPNYKLEINQTSGSGYFGISNITNGITVNAKTKPIVFSLNPSFDIYNGR